MRHDSVTGLTRIAEEINAVYGVSLGMSCTKQLVGRWRKGDQLPAGMVRFPRPTGNGTIFRVQECFDWVERYIEAKAATPSITVTEAENKAQAATRRERAKANREERLDKKEAETVVDRSNAENETMGIVQRLHNTVIDQDEREITSFCQETLKNLNVPQESIAVFMGKLTERQQNVTARRVEMFRTATDDYLKQL